MRDIQFIAMHRGGSLSLEDHRKLMKWAINCYEHVLPYYGCKEDQVLQEAMTLAISWSQGTSTTGDLMKASRKVHAHAREIPDPLASAVARSIGQGVATAHMADHCIGAALYAQKAAILAGNKASEERAWQIEKLPSDLPDVIRELVIHTIQMKGRGFGLRDDM
ncbi:putative immunity protein [uncultured Methanospirillum sp.]|uniref:putative immunity protein n=1 Tax=uncultured Methanospirillum sp. TaxID=262503 RepID=UPI0029C66839|nr:hypothetical protein [uncultured Methanospirillum sp.]